MTKWEQSDLGSMIFCNLGVGHLWWSKRLQRWADSEGLDWKDMECGPSPADTSLFYFSGGEFSGVKRVRVQLFSLSLLSSSSPEK